MARARTRTAKSPTRLGDVARLARVSTATVPRAINETGAVSEATRGTGHARGPEAALLPERPARSLALGRSDQIGLLVSDIANPFFPELVKAIERDAFQRGFEVILAETDYDHERLARSVRRFLERDVAGVIIMASEVDMPLVAGLARRRVPLVFLDLEVTGQGTSTVSVDYGRRDRRGGPSSRGPRPPRARTSAGPEPQLRGQTPQGLPGRGHALHRSSGPSQRPRRRLPPGKRAGAAREILAARPGPPRPCPEDPGARRGHEGSRAEGLSIPRDLSVVGFDDIAFASLADPPLSTVCLPRDALARGATAALSTVSKRAPPS